MRGAGGEGAGEDMIAGLWPSSLRVCLVRFALLTNTERGEHTKGNCSTHERVRRQVCAAHLVNHAAGLRGLATGRGRSDSTVAKACAW